MKFEKFSRKNLLLISFLTSCSEITQFTFTKCWRRPLCVVNPAIFLCKYKSPRNDVRLRDVLNSEAGATGTHDQIKNLLINLSNELQNFLNLRDEFGIIFPEFLNFRLKMVDLRLKVSDYRRGPFNSL